MTTIPVLRPRLPSAQKLLPYLERIDEARYYSNHGPLLHDLEGRLANHFRVDPEQLAIVANGTVALSAALVAVNADPRKKCLMPAWTFVGSAAAVWAANIEPYFVDVSAGTWMLDPEELRRRPDLDEVGSVMVVSAFGAPVDTAAWDAFTAETGIPVIIDGAASFDTVASHASAHPGRSPVMISLHATKAFGVGEGAIVMTTDADAMQRFRQICNFGIFGQSGVQILGYNGKLSEYHAAVGLATLDGWPERRQLMERLTRKYADALSPLPTISMLPGYGEDWVSCYCNLLLETNVDVAIEQLTRRGIETRRWWKSGVHVQPAYTHFRRDPLPVTEDLARRNVALPFFHDLGDDEFARVMTALEEVLGLVSVAS